MGFFLVPPSVKIKKRGMLIMRLEYKGKYVNRSRFINLKDMISEQDKVTIMDIARRYDVGEVLLFGSSANPKHQANDIDLAVDGIEPAQFFSFYGDLLFGLSKPVDLINLANDTKFNRLVSREGIRIYGRTA